MMSVAFFPHSISTKGATLRPVPCSALREPPYLSATSSHSSCIIRLYRSTSASVRKPWEKTKWRLPSRAWPKQEASWYSNFLNMLMRSRVMGPSFSTGQATSSMSMLVPASRAPPTMGIRPLRTSQKSLDTSGSWRKGNFSMPSMRGILLRLRASSTSVMFACSIVSSFPRHSISSAALSSSHRISPCTSWTMPSLLLHSRRQAGSNISTASTPVSTRSTLAASHASSTVGNTMNADALCA
mmetsp:Transcript_12601/g.26584  ORF Transcript_12601/g.26584 Transcript_12601/m.26584 type:complete len:241 (+) Transcript_12601:636-1358(+)